MASKRVLSIQSHVVHGYVGNNCAVFPLQLHEFEVDALNSVQFSTHTYRCLFAVYEKWSGQVLDRAELNKLYSALKHNNLHNYTHMLTGYCADESFLHAIADIIREQKALNPNFVYVCDPVMGDGDAYYVPESLMPIYRDVIVPLASVITPNQFELGQLAGMAVNSETGVLAAMEALHSRGQRRVVVSSTDERVSPIDLIYVYASDAHGGDAGERRRVRFAVKRRGCGPFVGCGDVFAALLLVWLDKAGDDLPVAVKRVLSTMQSLVRRTDKAASQMAGAGNEPTLAQRELRLIQSREDILNPDDSAIEAQEI